MRYPKLNTKQLKMYITAPSRGVGHKLESFDESIQYLKDNGFEIEETPSVRNLGMSSNTPEIRGREFNSCFEQDDHAFVCCASGGDFLFDMLDYVDFHLIQKHPKWFMGASDPTSLLYTLTVKYDIATMYGYNAGGFHESSEDPTFTKNAVAMMKQEPVVQHSSKKHAAYADFMEEYNGFDTITKWKSNYKELDIEGRCIGGCLDCLKDLIGTDFDETKSFCDKYQHDGIIYYFDNFALSAESVYLTLLQMKHAGWFHHTKLILFGRNCFESSTTGMSYEEAYAKALGDLPYIFETDIGHTEPCMVMINGAMLKVNYKNEQGSFTFSKI